jgi:hypothetical protein
VSPCRPAVSVIFRAPSFAPTKHPTQTIEFFRKQASRNRDAVCRMITASTLHTYCQGKAQQWPSTLAGIGRNWLYVLCTDKCRSVPKAISRVVVCIRYQNASSTQNTMRSPLETSTAQIALTFHVVSILLYHGEAVWQDVPRLPDHVT